MTVAASDGERALRREHEAREAAGLDVTRVTQKQLRQVTKLDTSTVMRLHGGFGLDPYSACIGLARAAVKRGARIYERSRVEKVVAGSKGVEIVLDGGVVRAGTVVIATSVATAEFKPLRRHFKRRESYLVMTEPIPAGVRRQLLDEAVTLQDTRTPRHRIRWTHASAAGRESSEFDVEVSGHPAVLRLRQRAAYAQRQERAPSTRDSSRDA